MEDRWCGFFLPGRQQYRSPQRTSVIFIKMMRIFESPLFWPMAMRFLHAIESLVLPVLDLDPVL